MIQMLSSEIQKFSTKKNVFTFAFLFMLMLHIISGKYFGVEQIREVSEGVTILEIDRFYGPEKMYYVIDSLGCEGRNLYTKWLLTLDFLFPLSYMFAWSSIIAYLFNKSSVNSKWHKLNLLPYLTGIFDYTENGLILVLLSKYPKRLPEVAWLTSFMITMKWVAIILNMAVIGIGIVMAISKKRHKSKDEALKIN